MDYYITYTVFSKKELIAMNDILKRNEVLLRKELATVHNQVVMLRKEYYSNDVSLLDNPLTGIIASVISETNYNSILIHHRKNETIKKGDIVIDETKTILGTISETGIFQSRVTLLSIPQFKLNGRIEKTRDSIVLIGKGDGIYEARIPREIPLSVGDIIESLEHPLYTIGVVGDISFEERDPDKKVLINTPTTISSIKYIEIIPQNISSFSKEENT